MAHERLLVRIRSLVRQGRYRLSVHAERERDTDQILITHFEEALASERLELLEDYPDDPRGHSHLLLGFTEQDEPIHTVCAIHEGTVVIITVYRPNPELWENLRVRKEKK